MNYKVNEMFVSIDGEGPRAGQPAVFIRFAGCSLRCSYCDTAYAQGKDEGTDTDGEDILKFINDSGISNVTLTGGEPLEQQGISWLLGKFAESNLKVSIETNGAVNIGKVPSQLQVVMDYKLPTSRMEQQMLTENLLLLRPNDALKFVCGNMNDMKRAKAVIEEFEPNCLIFFSPVFGSIDMKDMVKFLIAEKIPNARLQIQLHKIIWEPTKRGV